MTKPQNYYWGDHVVRKICDTREDAKHNKHSCEHQPLLNIPLENVVLDELHLMLRITGIPYNTACLRLFSAPKIILYINISFLFKLNR